MADGLAPPPAGRSTAAGSSVEGSRQRIGKMFFAEDIAYWVGPAPAISDVSTGATFGVSLVGVSGATLETDPVLLGGALTRRPRVAGSIRRRLIRHRRHGVPPRAPSGGGASR